MKLNITPTLVKEPLTLAVSTKDWAVVFKQLSEINIYIPAEFDKTIATPENIAGAVLTWILTAPGVYQEMLSRFTKFHKFN